VDYRGRTHIASTISELDLEHHNNVNESVDFIEGVALRQLDYHLLLKLSTKLNVEKTKKQPLRLVVAPSAFCRLRPDAETGQSG